MQLGESPFIIQGELRTERHDETVCVPQNDVALLPQTLVRQLDNDNDVRIITLVQ